MKIKFIMTVAGLAILSTCMSTSPQLGADAGAWDNYLSWYKVTPEVTTGDPTGFLGSVHAGTRGYRQIYVNATGEAVNRGRFRLPRLSSSCVFPRLSGAAPPLAVLSVIVHSL